MFPGKISPGDSESNTRRRIQLVATIEPPIAGVWVSFRNFDVDDPFDQVYGPNGTQGPMADVGLIDNNTVGNDNRFSQLGVSGTGYATTDENGEAVDEFTVTVQPGNNYRAAASVIDEALDQIDQADADAFRGFAYPFSVPACL